jgi:hypothetical protein
MTSGMKSIIAAAALVILAVAVVPGSSASGSDPKGMVLTLRDLPTGFHIAPGTGYRSAATASTDGPSITVAKYKSWGYVNTYQANFAKSGTPRELRRGASEIASSTTVYAKASGAEKSFASSDRICGKRPYHQLSMDAHIGDEATLCATTKKSGALTVQVYGLIWRHGRFKATVLLAGVAGTVSPAQAVKLAVRQDRRIG